MSTTQTAPRLFDLSRDSIRDLNGSLHRPEETADGGLWIVSNPRGAHAIACGIRAPVEVRVEGPAGYYCAGMNQEATVIVHGNVGVGVAENMMSGLVHVKGSASQSAGATGHGGLLIIDGNAGARCGISMKGIDIVVKGSIGHMSGFMAQAGTLVVCGDAGPGLGDSLYEARIFVRGAAADLGADCVEKEASAEEREALGKLLKRAGCEHNPAEFRLYGSARKLYSFHVDHADSY